MFLKEINLNTMISKKNSARERRNLTRSYFFVFEFAKLISKNKCIFFIDDLFF